MYFLTYEWIKKKVTESAPQDKPRSKAREMSGTILAGGMGEFSNQRLVCQQGHAITFVSDSQLASPIGRLECLKMCSSRDCRRRLREPIREA
jgi:hypothetical protein